MFQQPSDSLQDWMVFGLKRWSRKYSYIFIIFRFSSKKDMVREQSAPAWSAMLSHGKNIFKHRNWQPPRSTIIWPPSQVLLPGWTHWIKQHLWWVIPPEASGSYPCLRLSHVPWQMIRSNPWRIYVIASCPFIEQRVANDYCQMR